MSRKALLALPVASCLSCKEAPAPADNPLLAPPVNAALNVSARQVLGWDYQRALQADLNGDGSEEQVVLAADVVVNERDLPLWEDGHHWAVVVRERGSDTLVFSSFVPNGFVEAAVSTASSGAAASCSSRSGPRARSARSWCPTRDRGPPGTSRAPTIRSSSGCRDRRG